MKSVLCLIVCSLVLAGTTTAQKKAPVATLTSLVEAERAFAKASEENGTREAFLAFIAEDGTLFRPTAVKGKRWLLEHPSPPSPKRALLAWQPSFAEVARAGDIGYTFGPWEFKQDIKDEKPIAYGHFITVWQKQADGSWKFAVDLGVEHSQPTDPIKVWQLPANYKQESWKPEKLDLESARAALIGLDREFSSLSSAEGPVKAFLVYSAAEAILFRNGNHPSAGSDAIRQALSPNTGNLLTWQPLAADVSQSGDLGYTHGIYTLKSNSEPPKIIERGNYLRIWKRHNGDWKVVVDVANPLPPEVKNSSAALTLNNARTVRFTVLS